MSEKKIVTKETEGGHREGQWRASIEGEYTQHPAQPHPRTLPEGMLTYGDTREKALRNLMEACIRQRNFWESMAQSVEDEIQGSR